MITDIKCIITSGCSFSAWDNEHTWPHVLGDIIPHADMKYLGMCSSGNEMIQKKAALALQEALQTYKPKEILMLPMWSGLDRKAFYVSNEAEVNRMVETWKLHNHWWHTQFSDLKNNLEQQEDFFVNGTEKVSYNPLGGWYMFHSDLGDGTDLAQSFAKSNLDFTYGVHIGLENIVMLQNLCKTKGVRIFHQFFMDSVLESMEKEQDHQIINYLYKELDKDLIVCKSIHGFLKRSGEVDLFEDDQHPNAKGHSLYTEKELWPFLKKKLDNV